MELCPSRAALPNRFLPGSCSTDTGFTAVLVPGHCLQASQVGRELEAARAEVQNIKQQQEAERARVKKAIAEMKRKIDG